jgi:hypothetical protein
MVSVKWATSHSRTVPSELPCQGLAVRAERHREYSGGVAGEGTDQLLATSHKYTVPSSPLLARILPFGLNATDETASALALPERRLLGLL